MKFTSYLAVAVSLLIAAAVPAFGGVSLYNGMVFGTGTLVAPAQFTIPVMNRSGGTLVEGDVVVWRTDTITVTIFGDSVPGAGHGVLGKGDSSWTLNSALASMDSTLGSMQGVFKIWGVVHGTPANDTLFIMGKGTNNQNDYSGNISKYYNIKDTLVFVGGADTTSYMSGKHWTRIDSCRTRGTDYDSLRVQACEWRAITTTTSAGNLKVAGVMFDLTTNAHVGRMTVFGFARVKLTPVKVTLFPGTYFGTGTTAKYGTATTTAVAGAGLGKVLEPIGAAKAGYKYRCFINPAY